MQFAKLFTYPTGQLLVTLQDSDEEPFYRIRTESRHPSGVTNTMEHSYFSEEKRDEKFDALGEVEALKLFNSQRDLLDEMAQ
jgi:hypothetical protein